jgi:hypothetical protein
MEWAKSILYGGMIVNAKNADYKSSEKLILVCPICNEGVYLVKGHNRAEHARLSPKSKKIILVKESIVSSSFAHFHGVAEECELKSKYINQTTIQKAISQGRGQRLRFIQRRFGQIAFSAPVEKENTIRYHMKKENPFLADNKIDELIYSVEIDVVEMFKKLDIKQMSRELLEAAIKNPDRVIEQEEREGAIQWMQELEIDLHLEIVEEVANFLNSKSGYPCLIKAMDYGFNLFVLSLPGAPKLLSLNVASKDELHNNYYKLVKNISHGIVAFITGITWAIAIKDFEKKGN